MLYLTVCAVLLTVVSKMYRDYYIFYSIFNMIYK